MQKGFHLPFISLRIGRFTLLLISIALMFTLRPFLESFIGIDILVDIFATLILMSGIYAASPNKRIFRLALLIAFPTLISSWLNHFIESHSLFLTSIVLAGLFYAFMVAVILNYLFKEKKITGDTIAGAICAYFLIGLMWSSVFETLELVQPGSFNVPQKMYDESLSFKYYSYVTLTTLGYGDITPITSQARSFALLEAITGQIYLATLVARLVSVNILQSVEKDSP
ncbi:MAG: potassium channel family protein [Planctomycetota bacterium]